MESVCVWGGGEGGVCGHIVCEIGTSQVCFECPSDCVKRHCVSEEVCRSPK